MLSRAELPFSKPLPQLLCDHICDHIVGLECLSKFCEV